MKKKILISISIVLLIAISAIMLVACVPNRPDKFMAAFAFSDKWTMEIKSELIGSEGVTTITCDGKNFSSVTKSGDLITLQTYVMDEDGKMVVYLYNAVTGWADPIETDADNSIKEITEIKTEMLNEILESEDYKQLDKKAIEEKLGELFTKDDGKWYVKDATGEKNLAGYFTIKSGKMTTFVRSISGTEYKEMMTISLSGKVKLPSEAKK